MFAKRTIVRSGLKAEPVFGQRDDQRPLPSFMQLGRTSSVLLSPTFKYRLEFPMRDAPAFFRPHELVIGLAEAGGFSRCYFSRVHIGLLMTIHYPVRGGLRMVGIDHGHEYVIPSSIEGDSFRGFPSGKKSESMRRTDTEVRHGQSGCVTGRF